MKEPVEISKGQLWSTYDNEFIIEDYKKIGDEYWVYYKNTKTHISHNCLEEAFRSRFYPIVNKG